MRMDDGRPSSGDDRGALDVPHAASHLLPAAAFFAIIVLAAALRLPALDARPMHADEAVNAAKFGTLLQQGDYQYDPAEYHGPTLYYLTLAAARLHGVARYADLNEEVLRSVPALVGVLLVAAHVLLVPVIGFRAAAIAALLAAVSPAMVYYSRDYIHEMLLAAFSFGVVVSLLRYLRAPRAGWAACGGVSLGLMWATKETWILAFGTMGLAVIAALVVGERHGDTHRPIDRRRAAVHLLAALVIAGGVSSLLLSSFFSHPHGILDSLLAYRTYLARGAGASPHVHPWHYYLDLLLFTHAPGGPAWTEALIVGLGLVGLVVAVTRTPDADRRTTTFLGVYAIVMVAVYASIPYKTPWCLLGFLHALILLAGLGGARLLALWPNKASQVAVAAVGSVLVAHLGWQAWTGSHRYAADPVNPYVYAHTGPGIFTIAREVERLARAHPQHLDMPVEVISGENLWPLPWYLRRFTAVRWETAPVNDGVHAPVILATPDMEAAVARKLYEWRRPGERELYIPIFQPAVELRPQVEVRGYTAKSLWDNAAARDPSGR